MRARAHCGVAALSGRNRSKQPSDRNTVPVFPVPRHRPRGGAARYNHGRTMAASIVFFDIGCRDKDETVLFGVLGA